jgi:hypothetical protein
MTPPPADTLAHPSEVAVGAPVGSEDVAAAALRELDDLLATTSTIMGRVVTLVDRVVATGAAEQIAGLPVDLWLSQVARQTRTDRNLLLLAVETLRDMPALGQALAEGRVAWSQVVRIVYETKPLRRAQRQQLDALAADVLDEHRAYAPDDLVITVQEHVTRLRDCDLERAERAAERGEFVTLMPRLFGGGAIYGEFGTTNFTLLAEALDTDQPTPPIPTGDDDARQDEADSSDALERARARHRWAKARGRARAEKLVGWAQRELADTTPDGQSRPARPTTFVTVDVAILLGDRIPGDLLTRLAGGRMKVSSTLARRLVDERGTDLRLIVLDDLGEVIGVGRKHYEPPGWLREAIWARDVVATDPAATSPIRLADLDHVIPWDAGGPTDAPNLTAVSRTAHGWKTRGKLDLTRSADGTLIWTTPTSSVTIPDPPGDPPDT